MKQLEVVYNGHKVSIMKYDEKKIYLYDEDEKVIISDPMVRDDKKIHEFLIKRYSNIEQLKLF